MTETPSTPRRRAEAALDAENAADPHRIFVDETETPYAVHYARRMTHWLSILQPAASDALAIAVRGQHVRRFDIPRGDFPMDKAGYHAWRNRLKDHHADIVARAMGEAGYGEDEIARARAIVRKERLKRDPDAQALEDCACLVFLENEFVPFAEKHTDDKILDILRKTWVKMSPEGHALAAGLVPALPERLRRLVHAAIAPHP